MKRRKAKRHVRRHEIALVGIVLAVTLFFVYAENSPTAKAIAKGSALPDWASSWAGVPWDVENGETLITSDFQNGKLVVNAKSQYIYRWGYIWNPRQYQEIGNGWQQFEFPRTNSESWGINWSTSDVSTEVPLSSEEVLDGENYVLAYTCNQKNDRWYCGCLDENTCQRWQLQTFEAHQLGSIAQDMSKFISNPASVPDFRQRASKIAIQSEEIADEPRADFDGDGDIDFDDFFSFAEVFDKPVTDINTKFDLNGNGQVDFDDFFIFVENFGKKVKQKSFIISEDLAVLTKNIQDLNEQYMQSRALEKDELLKELKEVAKERKLSIIKSLNENNPENVIGYLLSKNVIDSFPDEIKMDIESPNKFTGSLEVRHVDDIKQRQNRYDYFLTKDNGERLQFYSAEYVPLKSGISIVVEGYQIGDKIIGKAALDETVRKASKPVIAPDTISEQKYLVLLVKFVDSGEPPITKEDVEELLFNDQIQKFFKEVSFNKLSLEGDVFGWYTLPREGDANGYCAPPKFFGDKSEVYEMLKRTINFKNYERLIVIGYHPCLSYNDGTTGKSRYIINGQFRRYSVATITDLASLKKTEGHPFQWTQFDYIVAHELGHNFGLPHASGWICEDSVLYGNCEHNEYGNPYDIMAAGVFSLHFNAFYKYISGWLGYDDIVHIEESGRYRLVPLESDSGMRGALIYVSGVEEPVFSLEYRRAIGFDSNLDREDLKSNQNGLFINVIKSNFDSPFIHGGQITRLLDMSPQTGREDVVLKKDGKGVFNDEKRRITIGPIISADESGITFDVIIDKFEFALLEANPLSISALSSGKYPFYIENSGNIDLSWNIAVKSNWISIKDENRESITGGILSPGEKITLLVVVQEPPSGYEKADIKIISNGGNFKIPVTVVIRGKAKCEEVLGECSQSTKKCVRDCNDKIYFCSNIGGKFLWRTIDKITSFCSSENDVCTVSEYPKSCSDVSVERSVCYVIDGRPRMVYDNVELCCNGAYVYKSEGGCASIGKTPLGCSTKSYTCPFSSAGNNGRYDVNSDGKMDFDDLFELADNFDKKSSEISCSKCDIDGNKIVDMNDVLIFQYYFNSLSPENKMCKIGQKIGDINGDEKITYVDYYLSQEIVTGKIRVPTNTCCADADKDGKLTVYDTVKINQIQMGNEESPGVCG